MNTPTIFGFFTASTLLLSASACSSGSDPSVPSGLCDPMNVEPDGVELAWVERDRDQMVDALVGLPPDLPRLEHQLKVTSTGLVSWDSREGFSVTGVSLLDPSGAHIESLATCDSPPPSLGACKAVTPALLNLPQPGDSLRVTVQWTSAEAPSGCFLAPAEPTAFTVTVPPRPAGDSTHAVAAHTTADGTLWFGLLPQGLAAIAPSGRAVLYPGIPTLTAYSQDHTAPQTPLLFDIAPAGDGALWIGGANTGISWFDPGPDLHDASDDRWAHVLPDFDVGDEADEDDEDGKFLKEMAETIISLIPTPDDTLWVASLNGLHRLVADASPLTLETVTPGAFLALTPDDAGLMWAGRTIAPAIIHRWGGDPWPDAPLLAVGVLENGATTVTPHPLPLEAITALAYRDGVLFIGSPDGLFTLDPAASEPALVPVAETLLDGLAVTALAIEGTHLWVAARDECAADQGRLLRLSLGEAGLDGAFEDATERGFELRDFNALKVLEGGQLFVSTVVPTLSLPGPVLTQSGCAPPTPEAYAGADSYLLPLGGQGQATPIGR